MSQYHYLDVDLILKEGDKAFLCIVDGEEIWIPKSQMPDWDDYNEGDKDVELAVTEWYAEKQGWV